MRKFNRLRRRFFRRRHRETRRFHLRRIEIQRGFVAQVVHRFVNLGFEGGADREDGGRMSGSRVMRGGCRRHLADRQGGGGVALRRRRDDNFRRVQPEFFGFFRVFRDRFFAFRANKRGQQRVNGVRVRERGDGLLKFPHILPLFQHDFFRRPFQADGGNVFFLELKKLFLRGFGGLFLFRHLDFKDVIISAEQKQRDKKYQRFFEAHSDFLPQIAQISQIIKRLWA